jgi:hypothetical protein
LRKIVYTTVFHLFEEPFMNNPPQFSIADKDVSITGEIQDLEDQSYFPFWGIDEPAIAEGYDISALQELDKKVARETIKNAIEFLDKLGIKSKMGVEELQGVFFSRFERIYVEYHQKAQEVMKGGEDE